MGAALCALVATGTSCRREQTSIVIVVNTDFDVPSQVSELHVTVEPVGAPALQNQLDFAIGGRRDQGCVDNESVRCLPLSFTIAPNPGRPMNAPTRVVVTARRAGASATSVDVVDRSAVISFQSGRQLAYGMFLPKACVTAGAICRAQGLVCTERGCESEVVNNTQLVPFTPGMEHAVVTPDGGADFDVRSPDASIDSSPMDAPMDVRPDSGAMDVVNEDAAREASVSRGNYLLSVGSSHACVLHRRTGRVLCWGENDGAQLGRGFQSFPADGGALGFPEPAPLQAGDGGTVPAFVGIAAGRDNSCAYTASNEVYCWGRNDQLYTENAAQYVVTPSRVRTFSHPAGASIVEITSVNGAYFLRYSNGAVNSWGSRYDSATADGPDNVPPPLRAPGAGSLPELAGARHICANGSSVGYAVSASGQLMGWGLVFHSRLGTLTGTVIDAMRMRSDVTVATAIPGIGPTLDAVASDSAALALLEDGRVATWGYNENFFVGTTVPENTSVAMPVVRDELGSNNIAVAIVGATGLAVTSTGTVQCFGARYGSICPDEGMRDTPTSVRGFTGSPRFTTIRGGFNNVCALTEDDRVFCWGGNNWGQSGAPIGTMFVQPTAPNEITLPAL